ncbi:phage tail protein, partial [Citrobacter braakii]|uniref:gp53-like domain-containing protein n=1 Tax=Citrobacter braakii TaxID=57706 RepID=UPI0010E7AB63
GLREAAKRDVGTGTNQIPDMSSFAGGPASGYQKLPGGLIIQWGVSGASSSTGQATATFPIAFPNNLINVMVSEQSNSAGAVIKWGCGASTKTMCTLWAQGAGGTSPSNGEVANFLAIGW